MGAKDLEVVGEFDASLLRVTEVRGKAAGLAYGSIARTTLPFATVSLAFVKALTVNVAGPVNVTSSRLPCFVWLMPLSGLTQLTWPDDALIVNVMEELNVPPIVIVRFESFFATAGVFGPIEAG